MFEEVDPLLKLVSVAVVGVGGRKKDDEVEEVDLCRSRRGKVPPSRVGGGGNGNPPSSFPPPPNNLNPDFDLLKLNFPAAVDFFPPPPLETEGNSSPSSFNSHSSSPSCGC